MKLHPLVTLFPNLLSRSVLAPFARFQPELLAPVVSMPLTTASALFADVTEEFDVSDPECQLGICLVDTHNECIELMLNHPKKGSDEIQEWIEDTLLPRINVCHTDPDTVYSFTDGSTSPLYRRSAAGYHSYRGESRIHSHMAAMGRAQSFDAEIIALGMAITHATSLTCSTIHIFSDGKAAVQSIFMPGLHAGQSVSLAACRTVHKWLDDDTSCRIIISHCPLHSGVALNEHIDHAVGVAANDPNVLIPDPPPRSWTYQCAEITKSARSGWAALAAAHGYWGQRFPRNRTLRATTHTSTFPLKRVGHSSSLCTCTIRCLTDHAPTGAYRMCFFPDQPTQCTCDCPELQTRRHIVDRCTHYV